MPSGVGSGSGGLVVAALAVLAWAVATVLFGFAGFGLGVVALLFCALADLFVGVWHDVHRL